MRNNNLDAEERRKMLDQVMNEKGLSQGDVANALGCSIDTINSWFNGRRTPEMTPQETADFCDLFGFTIHQLAMVFPGYSKRRAAIKKSMLRVRDEQKNEYSKRLDSSPNEST